MALEATRSRLAERSKTDGDEARSEPVESSKSARDAWVISSRGTDRLPSDASASASRSGSGPLVSLLLDPTESDPVTTSFGCVGAGVCVCFWFQEAKKKKKKKKKKKPAEIPMASAAAASAATLAGTLPARALALASSGSSLSLTDLSICDRTDPPLLASPPALVLPRDHGQANNEAQSKISKAKGARQSKAKKK